MVEETPQINPVDPDPGSSASSNGTGSPWQTNGVVGQPTFSPASTARGEATAEVAKAETTPEPDAASGEADATVAEGTDADAPAGDAPGGADDGTIFLASLAKAMQDAATAERTRLATDTDQRRETHITGINARRESEQARMHELADDDRKAIDAWVAAEQQRIQEEQDRRTAALEADLKTSVEEHGAKIDREIERVEAAVAVYRSDVDAYFARLEGDTDPLLIAQHAARRPAFPDLDKISRSSEPASDATPRPTDPATPTTDKPDDSNDGAGADAIAAAAAAVAPDGPATTAEAEAPAADATEAVDGSAEAPDAPAESAPPDAGASAPAKESIAISAAKAVGVMEATKPPTKLAQAWAAWNESTKAADEAAAGERAASDQADAGPFTLTPPSPAPTPAPGASDKATASSTAPTSDEGAANAVGSAAGTWKPPVADAAQSLAGGAMSWLRRDRDRDHGGR